MHMLNIILVCMTCLFSISCAQAGSVENHEAGDKLHSSINKLSEALKKFTEENGALPDDLIQLVPDYIDDVNVSVVQKVFLLGCDPEITQRKVDVWISLIYTPHDVLPATKSFGGFIAYTSRATHKGIRYAITSELKLVAIGEAHFQEAVAGRSHKETSNATTIEIE